jgi:hypothetical protein
VRPTSVTVIGWLAVVLGIMMIFSGSFGLLVFTLMPGKPSAQSMGGVPGPLVFMARVFDYFPLLVMVQVVVAATMIASGAAFLRLRAWARTALEVLAWLVLCYLIGFGGLWLYAAASMGSVASQSAEVPAVFFLALMGIGVFAIVGFTIPVVLVLRVLRGRTVREAVARDNGIPR